MTENHAEWRWCRSANAEDKIPLYEAMKRRPPPDPQPSNRFITIQELNEATLKLIPKVEEFDGFVGIPRSGMIPATLLSVLLNKPLFSTVNDKIEILSCTSPHGGDRMDNFKGDITNLLFVDDTVHDGLALRRIKEKFGDVKTACVFVTKHSCDKVDYHSEILDPPHFLEWNFFNSGYVRTAMFDIDGIFCENVPRNVCQNEEDYINWISNVKPIKHRIPTLFEASKLVTGRLEKYRDVTENWLKKHNFNYKELVMFPTDRVEERNKNHYQVVGNFKAEIFKLSRQKYFVESEKEEALIIKENSTKTVVCPNHAIVL